MLKKRNTLQLMESEIVNEGKAEDNAVKGAVKDLMRLEKEAQHAHKTAAKAESTLRKREKQEHRSAKTMNNAMRAHEIAVADLQAAQKNTKLKYEHRNKLLAAFNAKKACVEAALNDKTGHDKIRESKLAELRQTMLPGAPEAKVANRGVGLPGHSGPAVDNSGHAAGYGVDHNHVPVNSEGEARGDTQHNAEASATRPVPERQGHN